MRRVLASLLLAVFSFLPLMPLLLADDSNLPACCRRLGAHHCALGSIDAHGASFVQQKCAQFPLGGAALAASGMASMAPSQVVFAAIVSHPAAHAQTEARYRVSFSRAWQKRGPPALLA
ncbi:MAG TPA: hypothetical protein VK687_13975 [Bryobacteraceae bacterium]|nr:hypothetical protein [Bryobacteraceae bacterium]